MDWFSWEHHRKPMGFSHFQIMGLSWEMFPEANRKDVQRM
jgi:hypothetical protein